MNFIFNLNAFSWKTMELTATRRVSTFQMIKTVSVEAELAVGSGSSSFSR
jgi:hypothetical protein